MKNYYFRFLPLFLCFCLAFCNSSCSNDEEEDTGDNNVSASIYLDNSKQNISLLLSGISYTYKNAVNQSEISISIYGDEGSRLTFFTMNFPNVILSNVKVGDDLVTLSDSEMYMLGRYDEKGLYYIGQGSQLDDGTPIYGTGKVVVREFNQDTGLMRVQFEGITVYHEKMVTNGKSIKVNGEIKAIVDSKIYNP